MVIFLDPLTVDHIFDLRYGVQGKKHDVSGVGHHDWKNNDLIMYIYVDR